MLIFIALILIGNLSRFWHSEEPVDKFCEGYNYVDTMADINERKVSLTNKCFRFCFSFLYFVDKGKPLQIVKLGSGCVQKLKLNEKNLETILLHPDVKDKPVVIVSVVGAYKTGKSFLLGFLLKYFEEGVILLRPTIDLIIYFLINVIFISAFTMMICFGGRVYI